jgi:uncharacterized protein YjiK
MLRALAGIALMALVGCKAHTLPVAGPVESTTEGHTYGTVAALPGDSLVIAFEKTPCFGRCPVFKIKVYESGFATYEGLNFSERLGLYSARISQKDISTARHMAAEVHFFALDTLYDDPQVSDLPAQIIQLSQNGTVHRVVSRIGAPEKLAIFGENLRVLLEEQDWQPYDLR